MKCSNIKRKLLAFLDKELKEEEALKVKEHLEQCGSCREEYQRLKNLNENIGSMYKKVELSDVSREKLIDNVFDALNKNHIFCIINQLFCNNFH